RLAKRVSRRASAALGGFRAGAGRPAMPIPIMIVSPQGLPEHQSAVALIGQSAVDSMYGLSSERQWCRLMDTLAPRIGMFAPVTLGPHAIPGLPRCAGILQCDDSIIMMTPQSSGWVRGLYVMARPSRRGRGAKLADHAAPRSSWSSTFLLGLHD